MEADVPNEPMSGILGGGSTTGELDGIQAWKKGLRDKEKDEKENRGALSEGERTPAPNADGEKQSPDSKLSSQPLDEIQLFRLMMQKEKEKRDFDPMETSPVIPSKPGMGLPIVSVPHLILSLSCDGILSDGRPSSGRVGSAIREK